MVNWNLSIPIVHKIKFDSKMHFLEKKNVGSPTLVKLMRYKKN